MKELFKKREFTLLLLIMGMLLVILTQAPSFVSPENILRILTDTSILIMVSIGQFMVILTGGIDLSIASIIGFSGMAASMMNQYNPEMPVLLILFAGIGIGTFLGLINGLLIAYGKVPPIITTLGTMSIFRGFTFVLSKGQWVTAHEMTESYMNIPHGSFLGLPNLVWAGVIVSFLMYYFMTYVRSGRELYAIGGNKTAAVFVGVSEKKINLMVYSIVGFLGGLAGVMWTARYAAAVNETALGFELQTVAACVLGGVSIAGGSGTVPGVILGALFLGILTNALPVVNLSPFYQLGLQGVVILGAMIINTLSEKQNEKKLLNRRLQ
ncbi:MAG: ABC transporter permease [Spirochaetaceae bacterium]|nr:ABC transporter permease [Spirochaetaceae bacterium]